ncbi:lipopolysaccharide biosynthesis protein [Riemerella anatipestifer]|nr:lipopolysaccharide biosynthesis protein [Riemerella anatipestifer]
MNMLEDLKGKKILFFSVQTFNLEKEIIKKLEQYGAIVSYYDERPANNDFTKGIIRIYRGFLEDKINQYYNAILKEIDNQKFDYLFVNRGEVITNDFLEKFISRQPNCKRIFYTWDSFKNHSHPTTILHYFHKRFTFDRNDAKKYQIGFRPLYFMDKYREILGDKTFQKEYDLLFLGTAHSDRYIISNKISDWCIENDLRSFCYYYMHGRLVYYYKKIFDKTFKEFDVNKLSFNSLTIDEIIDLYRKSKVILDINHPMQVGLTMRTFESIGAGKKLITTNADIINYPFYNPNNICIIDRENVQLDKTFFETPYQNMSDEMYENCSMDGWINDIFFREEKVKWN